MKQLSCLHIPSLRLALSLIPLCLLLSCDKGSKTPLEEDLGPGIIYVTDPDHVLGGQVISLAPQIINLQPDGLLFITVGVQHSELTKLESENVLIARYMDGVILIASEFSVDALSKKAGKSEFREKLQEKLSELAKSDATVTDVYFESFLVR